MASSSLLDFITTLVHDPAAAAAYRADPQTALSAANLHDVTTADIDHLIPVVAESSSGSVWSASNAAHSFDTTSLDSSAFDTASLGGDPFADTSPATEVTAAVDDSTFDPAVVPDAANTDLPDWSADDSAADLTSHTSSVEFDSSFADTSPAAADPTDWSGTSTLDAVDPGSHAVPGDTDSLGFDDF